jgi:hypothetical protein
MDSDGNLDSPDADRWYWCPKCGALALNKNEFWPAGQVKKVIDYKGDILRGVKKLRCKA